MKTCVGFSFQRVAWCYWTGLVVRNRSRKGQSQAAMLLVLFRHVGYRIFEL